MSEITRFVWFWVELFVKRDAFYGKMIVFLPDFPVKMGIFQKFAPEPSYPI
ncbi:MAG: hypothetical protein MJY98_13065 [Fibrobacter sp.]|nr:hypothetical protein [Fibrobacter sp.]